jgi:hypothetical protein
MLNKSAILLLTGFAFMAMLAFVPFVSAAPSGANVSRGDSTSAAADDATSDDAFAGNVTSLDIYSKTTTQSWQGYFGNVTGTIQLADGNKAVMYNWSQASPRGEVYASTNDTVYWVNLQCLNFTATGDYTDEAGNGGTTSQYGTNLEQLQTMFNINASDADTVNATFNLLGAGTHNSFATGSAAFGEGECQNTRVYDNTGTGVNDKFEEVLQYEPVSRSVIFTSLLNQDASGFDSKSHDFEMLVLEDGHDADVDTTPYYFFVELQ